MKRIVVSVCIPVFNGADTIEETVESIRNQTALKELIEIKLFVQDNCSTDQTWPKILELQKESLNWAQPITINAERNLSNLGMVGNWNEAVRHRIGDFFILLSADDCLEPYFFERAVEAFKDSTIFAVSTNHCIFWSKGERRRRVRLKDGVYSNFADLVLLKNPFSINFTVFRNLESQEFLFGNRLFRRYMSCDYDLHLRVALSGKKVRYLNESLGRYRLHDKNLSRAKRKMNRHAALTVLGLKKRLTEKVPWTYRLTLLRFLIRTLALPLRGSQSDLRLISLLAGRIVQ